jgi:hypothetical protein
LKTAVLKAVLTVEWSAASTELCLVAMKPEQTAAQRVALSADWMVG